MLKIDTKKSLYKPLEVLLNGTTYTAPDLIDSDFIELLTVMQKDAWGNVTKLAEVAEFIFGIPVEVGRALDIRVLQEINNYFTTSLAAPEKVDDGKKKDG